jgi:two-component system, OmpR family, osmolarity sensor histidine kinase EnvZ
MRLTLKPFLPRGLYGRAALILIVPIVTIQLIVSIAFIQRYFEGVTRQLSVGVIYELGLIREAADSQGSAHAAFDAASVPAAAFGMKLDLPAEIYATQDSMNWDDLTGAIVTEALREGVSGVISVDLTSQRQTVLLTIASRYGPLKVTLERQRLSASNPHQLLVIMMLGSGLMILIAYAFLRNQLRPIARLAAAAEAFGKGETLRYRPRGALEVRAAGAAFLDMRARIERAIETRTLMLSGISHDLRTPLTRLRLGLSLLPEDDEVSALLGDVQDMERLVDEFLAFARGDAMEEAVELDPAVIATRISENAARTGRAVELLLPDPPLTLRLRPQAVQRAVENLVGNALRHGNQVRLSLIASERALRFVVEDDGPGIPEAQRERAVTPFARLDDARSQNRGGGVGLGMSIAADIARSHGGNLTLGRSETLGGLRAELRIAR